MAKGKPIKPVGHSRQDWARYDSELREWRNSSPGKYEPDGSSKIHRPKSKLELPKIESKESKKKEKIKKKTLFDIIDIDD